MRIATSCALVLLAAVVAGCGGSDESSSKSQPVAGTFVGTLSGSDAYVAVVAGKENVVAYVCDGERGIAQLFTGRRSGNAFNGRADGARIELELSDDGARGRATLAGGRDGRFSAQPAGGEAGFYNRATRLDGREVRLGWVVGQDGSQRGALVRARTTTVAPSLDPSSGRFTLSGKTLTATRISSSSADAGFQFAGGFQFMGG